MKLKPYEPCTPDWELKQTFREKFNNLPEHEKEASKKIIQEEYLQALEQLKIEIDEKQKERYEHNLKSFLEDPKGMIDELNVIRGRTFDLGEVLVGYGIATTTIKRQKGKGVLVGKGTLAEHTKSNFLVTAKIGDKTLSMAVASSNDRRDKERSMTMVAAILAEQIAENEYLSLKNQNCC